MRTIILTLLLIYNSVGFAQSNDTSTITILQFGMPGPSSYVSYQVARKYNFKIISVAGCVVTPSLKDSVRQHNSKSYLKLDKINGPNWEDRYKNEVKHNYSRDSTMIELAKKSEFLKAKCKVEHKGEHRLNFIVDSILPNNIFRINAVTFSDTSNDVYSFFRFYIDYNKMTIINKEENTIPFDIEKDD